MHQSLITWLESFNQCWPQQLDLEPDRRSARLNGLDSVKIEMLLNNLVPHTSSVPLREMSFNTWSVAGLARKELLNASVLKWLLDPSESHGLLQRPLNAFLALLNEGKSDLLPSDYGEWCRLNTEVLPSGDQRNRIDIEIDAEKFYLLIEVKIDARDQPDQLLRYQHEAIGRAGKRPWRVVYLTAGKFMVENQTSLKNPFVVPLIWSHLADHLGRTLRNELRIETLKHTPAVLVTRATVAHFLDHIRKF